MTKSILKNIQVSPSLRSTGPVYVEVAHVDLRRGQSPSVNIHASYNDHIHLELHLWHYLQVK